MAQFAAHRNENPRTLGAIPYLLDVQSDLLGELDTRVVVPLYAASRFDGGAIARLMPILEIEGERHVMVTPQLAGIARRELGSPVADLSASRAEIIAALDFLITGI